MFQRNIHWSVSEDDDGVVLYSFLYCSNELESNNRELDCDKIECREVVELE